MAVETRKPKILFCSYHSYLDPTSGAAIATRDLLEMLSAQGWECAVLSGPDLDFGAEGALEAVLRAEKVPLQIRSGNVADVDCTLYHCLLNGVTVHAYAPVGVQPRTAPTQKEGQAFLSLAQLVEQRFRPNILLTFGGHWLMFPLVQWARNKGMKVVFALHNFDYTGTDLFRQVDAVLVPSHAAQEHYQTTLGITSTAIPCPWNWERIRCPQVQGRFVTFVNPQPYKGALWFARIAYEMHQRRPDIQFLVVEGRGKADWLSRCDLDLNGVTNLHRMPTTPDARQFYAVSRVILVPSLCQEAFGRVAVEALINGIPVLASNRGGLPEALAEAGFLFDIPPQYTPQWRQVPSAEEVAPWLHLIERLWDDEAFHQMESERGRRAAETWRTDRLWPRFEEFFLRLLTASD